MTDSVQSTYLVNRGNGREDAVWIAFATANSLTIMYGKKHSQLRFTVVPKTHCRQKNPLNELDFRASKKRSGGYAKGTDSYAAQVIGKFTITEDKEKTESAQTDPEDNTLYWYLPKRHLPLVEAFLEKLSHPAINGSSFSITTESGFCDLQSGDAVFLALVEWKVRELMSMTLGSSCLPITHLDILNEGWVNERYESLLFDSGFKKAKINWNQVSLNQSLSKSAWF